MTERQLAALAVGAAVLAPTRLLRAAPTVCTFRRITGRPCPTCGMTRSWNALGRGHLRESFRQHPFGPPAMAVALTAAIAPSVLSDPRLRSPKVVLPLSVAWLATWLVRFVRAS